MPVEAINTATQAAGSPDNSSNPQWMPSAQRILRDVMALPREAREAIAVQLEASLDEFESQTTPLTDTEFREAWANELNRRWEDYESGHTKAIPYDEVMATLRSRYPS